MCLVEGSKESSQCDWSRQRDNRDGQSLRVLGLATQALTGHGKDLQRSKVRNCLTLDYLVLQNTKNASSL